MVPVDPSYCESVSEAGQAKLDKYFDLALDAVGREVFNGSLKFPQYVLNLICLSAS